MIKRRRAVRRGPRKRDPSTPRDNKKLLILRILDNHPRGLTRNKIGGQLKQTQEDTELKLVLNEMMDLTWVSPDSKPVGDGERDYTWYKIRSEGKRTLKELDEFLKSNKQLKKLDAFDTFWEDERNELKS